MQIRKSLLSSNWNLFKSRKISIILILNLYMMTTRHICLHQCAIGDPFFYLFFFFFWYLIKASKATTAEVVFVISTLTNSLLCFFLSWLEVWWAHPITFLSLYWPFKSYRARSDLNTSKFPRRYYKCCFPLFGLTTDDYFERLLIIYIYISFFFFFSHA